MDAAAAPGGRDGEEKEEKRGSGGGDAGDKRVSFTGLFRYADGTDVMLMLLGTVGALANGVTQPIMTLIFGQVIDAFGGSVAMGDVLQRVNKAVLNFVYLGIATAVVSFLQVSCWTMTGERQATRIRSLYLKSVLRQEIAFFDVEMTTGQVVSRMSGDTVLVQDAIGEKVGKFQQLIATFVGGFVIAFVKGWLLSLVMLACIPPVVIAGGIVSKMLSKISSKGQTSYSDAGNVVEQTLGNIKTVVSFNGEKQAIATYNKLIHKAYKAAVEEGITNGFGMGSVFFIFFSSYGLAIWYGGKLILSRGYSGGDVINILFAIMTGAMSLGNATPCMAAFAEGQSAAYRLFATIKRKPEIDPDDPTGKQLEDIKGDVDLKHVYFSYPARPEQLIFDGFSLHVSSGTTMAIVGESGSGKSTVISLVERFYDPQAGEVLIDGINIKNLRLDWIRGKIGLVNQEPLLFMTSIKDNISYGKEDATIEEIKRAAELANAANFIDKLPNGYDTMVGQRGAQLSGGQKQRIAIARAIIKDPRILLLDEATSALDVESERIVQEALNRIMVNRTTLVVAHRLSTVRNADCISVVQQGKIVEQGPHDELIMNPDGAYSQLIRLQESQEEEHQKDQRLSDPRSKSRSLSLKRSISRGSAGNSSRHSLTLPFGMPGSVELLEGNDANRENQKEQADDSEAPKKAPMGRLAGLNKPELPILLLGALAAGVHGVLFPMFGLMISNAIKTFYEPPHELRKHSSFWGLMCVVLGIVSIVSVPVEYFLFGVAGGKLIERIRALSFRSIVHQEVSWFDDPKNSRLTTITLFNVLFSLFLLKVRNWCTNGQIVFYSGALGAKLSVDALNVRRLVGDNLALLTQVISTLITGFVIAFVADWKLTLIILCVMPLSGAQGYAQVKFLKGFSQDAKMLYEDASQVATDAISSIRTVASFCAEKRVMTIYDHKCEASKNQGVRTGMVGGLGFGFSFMMMYLTYGLCFYVGGQFVRHNKSSFGDVFKVFFALMLATIGVSQTSALASDSTKAKDSSISIFALLDRKSKIDSGSDEGLTLDEVKGDIDFRHVSFKYPSRPDVQIFSDFTLHIPSGKTVALVGESGSGKSTVISLLERFYNPDSGTISLDGVEIKSLKLNWLRDQMGLVGQEPVLFNDTIRANIAYGKHGEVTEEELIKVAKAANAHEFISSLPQGYDTTVGERGVQLSGGQKQRVAIARAILKDPRILLLDEATSALDAESERIVQDALDNVMVGRTTIIVAHRLSTIKSANIIAVLKDGAIVEKGRHETLMNIKDGFYASLVELRSASS
ncbi:ABC transporter B family member 9-like isoform X1 [Panicum hallii]|uniref:ABC transporter B family member 9-like isoform X1 n=1 Tax=Panicum hallii TaxID=206008 RepID=UPI000DF4D49A|nr:ABC transporter B family member 9-like isoform X1 [Panicum hallii]